jgi:hypothetical protein
MTQYRFLDAMGDVVADGEYAHHAAAIAAVDNLADDVDDVQRVEFLGPDGDWRWAGPLHG